MGPVVRTMLGVMLVAVLFPQKGRTEVNKYGTALAADVWNSFKTVDDLESFLKKGKKKADQAEIKKILSQLKVKPAAVFVNRESVQFGTSKTNWSLDAEGGVWVNGKLFVAKDGSSIGETLKQYQVWKKQNVKTSMISLWVSPAYAQQTQSGLAPADDAAYVAFMTEFGQLVNKPCLYQMGEEALKKIAEKSPAGTKPKITTMGIICSDQNPNKETIYAAASGSNIAIMMNGEYANSPSTSKSYLKKVRISLNGENRVNVNFIESATGSDVHTMEVTPPGGKTEILDKNQIQSKSTIACTAELAQRMVTAINTVCDNRKASGYVQKSFGQTSGPAPAKAGAAGSEAQAK